MDRELLLSYREATKGQILHEGISEAGAMGSVIAAGTSYATHGEPMIPIYIFYSMFGFQRTGDAIWALADQLGKGFLLGATAGRTTLNGEGLQHQDGHSMLLASTNPACVAYDPAFAFELAVIVEDALRRMYGSHRRAPGRRGRLLLPDRLQRAVPAAGHARGHRRRGHPARHLPVRGGAGGGGPAGADPRLRGGRAGRAQGAGDARLAVGRRRPTSGR